MLLANGTPVNFFHNQSLPLEVADLVFSEMVLSLKCLSENKLDPKLFQIEKDFPEYEQLAAGIRADLYMRNISSG